MHNMLAEFLTTMQPFDRDAVNWQTLPAFLEACALKNDVIQGRVTDPHTIVEQARRLDQMFATAYEDIPYSFEYEVTAHRGRPYSDLPAYKRKHFAIDSFHKRLVMPGSLTTGKAHTLTPVQTHIVIH